MTSLAWEGCVNVRDLGGLPTEDGRRTRLGGVVRSDNVRRLTDERGFGFLRTPRFDADAAREPAI